MKTKLLMLLALGSTLLMVACALRRVRDRDYIFQVTGFVTAEDGSPLQDVEVILQVDTPIYEALTPVKSQLLVTSKGAFIFRSISHTPTTKYSITVRKDGFEPQTVSGSAPPSGHHTIRLKRAEW